METAIANETLAEWYLRESWAEFHGQEYGRMMARAFRERLQLGEGVGQAFYNAALPTDQTRMVGTIHDPFHGGVVATHDAIEFLTTRKGR